MKKFFVCFILFCLFVINLDQLYAYKIELWVKAPFYTAGERYSASQDYSNQQGYRNWYYQYAPEDNHNYQNMGGYGRCWEGSSGIWAQPKDTCCLCLWHDGGHPGSGVDAVRTWKAPSAGNLLIYGEARDTHVGDDSDDGVDVIVVKNEREVWKSSIPKGGNLNFNFSVQINANDYLRFRISDRGNPYYDNTKFSPTIEYATSGLILAKECSSPHTNFDCIATYQELANKFGASELVDGIYYAKARTFEDDGRFLSESAWAPFTLNAPPQVISVSPNSGLFYHTQTITFTTKYRDNSGANDINRVYFAISPADYRTPPNDDYEDACCRFFENSTLPYYFGAVYIVSQSKFEVAKNLTTRCPWHSNTNFNGDAILRAVTHQISDSNKELTVSWTIEFNRFRTGIMNLYLMVVDNSGQGNDAEPGCIASWKKLGQITFYGDVTTTPPQTTTPPPGGGGGGNSCNNHQDCRCYELCINGRCTDFRGTLAGCDYYDNCRGDQTCCNNNICNPEYCFNVDEQICEDVYYICHGYFVNCGVNQ
ncbi:MAG: hypothetical protein N3E38_03220 [Candidatus Aenigmarchaeota archaeon]|nr:hypothetical protein [Candidatus Aenigmarchaeota archaeon]